MNALQRIKEAVTFPTDRRTRIVVAAWVFFLLVCLSLAVVDAWQAWKARAEQIRDTEINITNMALALAQHADDTLRAADLILSGLVERVEYDGTGERANARLHKMLTKRVEELPQLSGIYIFDEHGDLVVDSNNKPFSRNVADRSYFQFHRQSDERTAHIGPLVKNSTGNWRLTVSRRLNHVDGSFSGVVLAGIDIEYFKDFYSTFDIGKNGLIILGLNQGTLLVRRPFFDKYVGVDLNEVPIFRDYVTRNHSGVHTAPSTVDGKDRINAYRHLTHYPLFVAVALSKEEALEGWVDDTLIHTVGIILMLVPLALLGNWLLTQIKLRLEAEAQLLVVRDSLHNLNQHLHNMALEDGLTGLANRRHFDLAFQEEFGRALRNATPLALIMIDVDWFKQFNDIYGHVGGDECLRRIGALLLQATHRSGDLAARYGGEELVVMLPQTGMDAATAFAENLRETIHAQAIRHEGSPFGIVTVSIGVASIIPVLPEDVPAQLIKDADLALYTAKARGRNRVARFSDINAIADSI